jgi:hypothetical protein
MASEVTNAEVARLVGWESTPHGWRDPSTDETTLEPPFTTDDALALRVLVPALKAMKCGVRILYPLNFDNVSVEAFRHPREEGEMVRLFTAIKKTLAEALSAVVVAVADGGRE